MTSIGAATPTTGETAELDQQLTRKKELVTFDVGNMLFGVDVEQVSCLVRMVDITPLPGSAYHIEGVINLRGEVVPVVSLYRLLGRHTSHNPLEMYILVANTNSKRIGLTIESMSDLYDVEPTQLERPDEHSRFASLLSYVAKLDDGIVFVLDADKLGWLEEADFQDLAGTEQVPSEPVAVSSGTRAILQERAAALRQSLSQESTSFKRFFTLTLGAEKYAIDADHVERVLWVPDIVPVPGTENNFAGLMNYSGDIVWVVDLKCLLSLPPTLAGNDERVVIVDYGRVTFAFLVDIAHDVVNIPTSAIRPAMMSDEKSQIGYITEEIFWKGELIGVLDLSKLGSEVV